MAALAAMLFGLGVGFMLGAFAVVIFTPDPGDLEEDYDEFDDYNRFA